MMAPDQVAGRLLWGACELGGAACVCDPAGAGIVTAVAGQLVILAGRPRDQQRVRREIAPC